MRKSILTLLLATLLFPITALADEGMWLPLLLKNQKYAQMRKMGLKLSAEEIYSVNQACIKDAVVGLMSEGANLRSFGTASFISDKGLIITNYHVVLSYIEQFSTKENDFLKYGYWAKSFSEESNCRGLELKQLIRMEDVTSEILQGTQGLKREEKRKMIDVNGKAIADKATKGTKQEALIQAVFANNQYIMSVYNVYKDIRMVAAPPFAIGKFGGNEDNYSWPRHAGDFALLRVYADENNNPKSYSKTNTPYKPKKWFEISSAGVKEGDFVMTPGFPGTTREYIPSFALDKIIYSENAARVAIRGDKLNILNNAISENPELKFRYTTRTSSVGNSYLRWKGEIQGVTRMNLVEKKREEEKKYNEWANSTPQRAQKYATLLEQMDSLYKKVSVYNLAEVYFNEAGINGSEIVPFIGKFEKLVSIYSRKKLDEKAAQAESKRLLGLTNQFFNNWDSEIDRKMFRNLMFRYYKNMPDIFKSQAMVKYITQYEGDIEKLSSEVFEKSIFTKKDSLIIFLNSPLKDIQKVIKEDALYQLSIGYYMINVDKIANKRTELQSEQLAIYEKYMKGYLEMNNMKTLYPDANSSQRVSYGKVEGVRPQDGLIYNCFTTLDGVSEKALNNIGDEQFYMPKKLRDIHYNKDYGRYADNNGNLNVNFLTNAHTTSGNSGSPVLNGKGELVGINFDRIWQGVASDYRYDRNISRAIAVDIRYIIFLLDKYSPTQYIFNELVIN